MKLPNDYQNFIALSRYARWLPEKNRRETWEETVARYFDFMAEHLEENTDYKLDTKTRRKIRTCSA
jgi:ribonucleoside-diphosphate reductase alpha chain